LPPDDSLAARARLAASDSMPTVMTMWGNTIPPRSGNTGRLEVFNSDTGWSFHPVGRFQAPQAAYVFPIRRKSTTPRLIFRRPPFFRPSFRGTRKPASTVRHHPNAGRFHVVHADPPRVLRPPFRGDKRACERGGPASPRARSGATLTQAASTS